MYIYLLISLSFKILVPLHKIGMKQIYGLPVSINNQYHRRHLGIIRILKGCGSILLRASTDVTAVGWRLTEVRMPIIWARWRRLRVMPASSSFPSTGVDPWVGLNGSTLAENITKQSGHQRALLVHHAPVLRQKKKKKSKPS